MSVRIAMIGFALLVRKMLRIAGKGVILLVRLVMLIGVVRVVRMGFICKGVGAFSAI